MTQPYQSLTLITKETQVTNCRYYHAKDAKSGVIYVGGIGGNFDSPAKNLYSTLPQKLQTENISGLRVQFRYPTDLEESIEDVLVGARFLESQGVIALGLVGHSFGGAVVIQAATELSTAKTVVTLATQEFGAEVVNEFSAGTSILLIHGGNDETLSVQNSRLVFRIAREPKRLVVLESTGHGLTESAYEVYEIVHDWLLKELKS
jgi:dienelactone hydrolase